jgi:hypothetical protein
VLDGQGRNSHAVVLTPGFKNFLTAPALVSLSAQQHALFRSKLRRVLAVDNGRDDVGRQPGKAQKAIDIVCGYSFLAGDRMHGQIGVLHTRRAWTS